MGTTKEKEIETLKELVAMDGYFADYFGKDIDQMIRNINNDFPIEIGTEFNSATENKELENKELRKQHRIKISDICKKILCAYAETKCECLYELANQELGLSRVIKLKRVLGLDLSRGEIDYLIDQLDNDKNSCHED